MTFVTKLDDKKLNVDLSITNLADVLQYCKPKEQFILLKKFGLMTGKEIPLQRIGNEFNMTRERARQIESQALMRFRRLIVGNDRYLKLIDEAKKILAANGGLFAQDDFVAQVAAKNVMKLSLAEIKLVLMSDFEITHLRRNTLYHKSFYLDPLYEELLTQIGNFCMRYFAKRGNPEDMYTFIDKLKKEFVVKYTTIPYLNDPKFYINVFTNIRGMSMFDGSIGLSTFDSVNPKTIKAKLLYVFRIIKKPLHYQEAANKIMEHFPEKPIKVSTVHNEMVKSHNEFVNVGLGTYTLKERWFYGGVVMEIIARILQTTNRPMTIQEIKQYVLKEKMVAPNTIMLNLHKYKDRFVKDAKGLYMIAPAFKDTVIENSDGRSLNSGNRRKRGSARVEAPVVSKKSPAKKK